MHGGHCLPRLDAYLEGQLGTRTRGRVEDHLAHCAECRAEAARRARVLAAARTVDSRPVPGPVMRRRGVSGRLVVGALALAVLVGALLTMVWMAGAPTSSTDAAGTSPEDAAALVSRQTEAGATAEELVEELRTAGWSVPSLAGVGLRPLRVEAPRQADGAAGVAVAWGRGEPLVTVLECRGTRAAAEPAPAQGCTGPASSVFSAARQGRLEVGTAYRIADLDDGGWTAELSTARAAYRVEAHLPRGDAEDVLTQLVVSERSGVAELRHDDAPDERWERGLDRLRQAVPTGIGLLTGRPSGH